MPFDPAVIMSTTAARWVRRVLKQQHQPSFVAVPANSIASGLLVIIQPQVVLGGLVATISACVFLCGGGSWYFWSS